MRVGNALSSFISVYDVTNRVCKINNENTLFIKTIPNLLRYCLSNNGTDINGSNKSNLEKFEGIWIIVM